MPKGIEKLPPALPRDVPDYHGRQASHCRALAGSADSPVVKARLLREAEEHEQIACAAANAGPAGEARARPASCGAGSSRTAGRGHDGLVRHAAAHAAGAGRPP